MTEMTSKRHVHRRATTAAWHTRARGAMILAVVVVAACDESVVAPPAALVAASPPSALLSPAPASDRDILIALYETTDGPNWLNSDNWLTDAPLGDWYGVDTDASGRVVRLDLVGMWDSENSQQLRHGLSGAIPAELGGLANLEGLSLGNNELTGPIPAELGGLANLERLSLGNNELTGPIPAELGGLANLEGLWLSANQLSGPIPAELGGLANLEWLSLGNNELSGPIPAELGGLANLKGLWLNSNQLSGPIPAELGGLANLETLSLGNNELSGPIPAELGGLANLEGLWLHSNQLSGPIPPELGGLANLEGLSLGNNELSGPIPAELGGLANLEGLYLGYNQLSGPIPAELGGLAELETLILFHNQFSGTVPLSFLQLLQLREFRFQENAGLCLPTDLLAWYEALEDREGPVCPDAEVLRALYEAAGGGGWTNADGWLGDGPLGQWYGVDVDASGRVSTVDLEGNGLSGRLPGRLGDLAGLTTLRIGDNALSGRLPSSLARTPLQELRYANTDLCVPAEVWFREWLAAIPQHEGTEVQCPPLSDRGILIALYDATGGPEWTNSGDWLTDAPLGEWYGVSTDAGGRVVGLDLQSNGLEGPIPRELGGLAELETLILFENELTGSIPPELGALAKAKLVVLAANQLSGPIPAELGGLADVEELHLNGNGLTSVPPELGGLAELAVLSLASNELTSLPPELGELGNLRALTLNFNQLTSVPPELGGLANLAYLRLWSNELTSVPPELGELSNLQELDLEGNRLTAVPPELARLDRLAFLWLASNELTSLPPELGELGNLWLLDLEGNRLTAVPVGPGGFASLGILDLSSNEFTSFPWELGELDNLQELYLDGNRLTDIPPGLGRGASAKRLASHATELPSFSERWSESDHPWRLDSDEHQLTFVARNQNKLGTLLARMGLDGNRSSPAMRSRVGSFASLEILDLSSNEMSGSLPAGLVELTGLTSLSVADNAGLAGALPFELTALERLEDLHTTGTGLCAPADPTLLDWLEGVTRQRVALCGRGGDAAAYLTQVVQSREFPVPLVAGEPALLRVFVTAERVTNAGLPPVRATFYRDGAMIHEADIPAKSDPIPAAIDESSLSKSANVEIPGWVIQPGLEVVIEPDPDGTLDPALGVAGRIPATGRMAVDVHAVPVFEVTLVPFLWEESPDASILEITAAMAGDPEGHELLEDTRLLLPVAAMDVKAHESVATPTNNGFAIMEQTEMIRVAEGGRGHYLGVMAGPTGPGRLLGVANGIGSWSSFSVLDSETIAHEFGHNRNLY